MVAKLPPQAAFDADVPGELVLRSVRALGITQARWIADYFRTGRRYRDEDLDPFVASGDLVRIDVSRAHFWDITAIGALDKVVLKFRREGTEVEVLGLNEASATLVDKFAVHDKDDADDLLLGH